MPKQLVLVDGSSYLHRAYHALDLTGPEGQPTGAIYGVINMLRALTEAYTPEYFAVVFDAPGKTFRHEIYPEYKSHRPPTPEDLKRQFEVTRQIIVALGYPLLQYRGVEADDVIGTLARKAVEQGLNVLISTGDKDMAQLVNDKTHLIDTMKKKRDEALTDSADKVKQKFGVLPEQIADYLALVGDSSDGIPGVPGVGPKTAAQWLNLWGDIAGVIEHVDEIKGEKTRKVLREKLPILETYLDLTTIKCALELEHTPLSLVIGRLDSDKLSRLYRECGFRRWLEALDDADGAAHDDADDALAYRLVLTEASLRDFLERIRKAGYFAFDIALDNSDYIDARIVGIALAVAEDAVYIPLAHSYPGVPHQLERETCLRQLAPVFEDADCAKSAHDIKRVMHALANYDIVLRGVRDDSMLAAYVCDSIASDHSIPKASRKYLAVDTIKLETIAGKGAKQIPFPQLAVKTAGDYWAQRAAVGLRLGNCLRSRMEKDGLTPVYERIEMPLLPVLEAMERKGVLLDGEILARQSGDLKQRMLEVESKAFDLVGDEFNINSPRQIQAILYDRVGLKPEKKTKGGQRSTAEDVLKQLASEHELPELILKHRALNKLKSTYTDKLPLMVNPHTGRIHTSYHQAVTATGRLSSSDPNLQNIPIRTEEGRKVRKAFIAPQGYCLLAIDYSQIEMRIMAHMSGDAALLKRFAAGDDIHLTTAAEVFGCAPNRVSRDQRRIAKAINFGLIYGMSAFGLAKQLGLARSKAVKYVEKYFEHYPAVKDYMEQTRARARERGFVETITGRRLYLPDIKSRTAPLRRYAERTAINAPMQGSAADIIKKAMIDIHQYLPAGVFIIMQVHDELVLEVPQDKVREVSEQCCDRMCKVMDLNVPLTVDAGDGANWDEAH